MVHRLAGHGAGLKIRPRAGDEPIFSLFLPADEEKINSVCYDPPEAALWNGVQRMLTARRKR
jgi:hypothetical protein